jgi:hypothetical protein
MPQEMLEHLKIGGRLAAFVGTAPVMKAQIITRIDEKQYRVCRRVRNVSSSRSSTPCSRRASSSDSCSGRAARSSELDVLLMQNLTAPALAEWLADTSRPAPVLLDVREPWEIETASIAGEHVDSDA